MDAEGGTGTLRDRRAVLSGWLRWLAGSLLLFPLFSFLAYRAPKKQRYVEVHRVVAPGGFLLEQDFVLFADGAATWAVSRRCTHLGCRLNYRDQDGILLCPCHESRFNRQGERLSGPARKNLPRLEVDPMLDEERRTKGYRVAL